MMSGTMSHTELIRRGFAVVVSAVVMLGAAAGSAEATFPGHNGLIAYADSGSRSIWTVDPVTGDLSELIPDGSQPAWSANGQRLAFTRAAGIWVAHADGSGQAQLSSGTEAIPDSAPTWSPDGTRIAFNRNGGIWIMRADGTGKSQLTADGGDPSWSPDGRRIAFSRLSGVWTIATNGADARRVASEIQIESLAWSPEQPDWSPDGRQLVLQYSFLGGPCDGCFMLHRIPAGGGAVTRIDSNFGGVPSWSPDGEQIVAQSTDGLKLFNAAGGWRFLREGVPLSLAFPAWQPVPAPSPDDRTPPTVAWSKPVSGQEISGVLSEAAKTCLVEAHDDSGIAYTENYVDGGFHDKQVFAPWSCEIDTRTLSDGPHTLTVRAYDRAGNFAEASAHVTVRNGAIAAQPGSTATAPSGTPGSAPPTADKLRVTSRQARRELKRVLATKYRSFARARRHRIRCRPSRGGTVQTCRVRWSTRQKTYTSRLRVRRSDASVVVKVLSLRVAPKRS
jgi:Bacterial Ig domain/WD40-like Beta Propeller Repeat